MNKQLKKDKQMSNDKFPKQQLKSSEITTIFKPGDIVKDKLTGQKMIVRSIEKMIVCRYVNHAGFSSLDEFSPEELEVIR